MLSLTFTLFILLCTGSIAMFGSFRVTINGIVPKQTNDYNACVNSLKTKFSNYSELETILKDNFHCITNSWDRASYLSNVLNSIVFAIIINIIYLFTFYFVCSTLVDVYKVTTEDLFTNLKYIAYIGYFVWVSVIAYGFYTILQTDRYEEIIKMSRYREFVKIKSKL